MPVFIDQTGRELSIPGIPQRIVSIVPSQTELLFDLGLDKEVCGITKFCVHPGEWFRTKTRVGGTKQLKMDIIHSLQPDLIIANKEENVKEQVEELEKHFPVWISDINDLLSSYQMIENIGEITGRQQPATTLIHQIKENFKQSGSQHPTSNPKPRTAYFIWQNPYMTVGGDTFIHAMLEAAGFDNIFAQQTRYPEITVNDLLMDPEHGSKGCQLLLLSSEPYPFKEKHINELQALLPSTRILLVDGEMFSWYGSRLQWAPAYFSELRAQLL
jgi:ABC-type Fe3+-hydroxamate transport system substrate-binding protein